MFIYVNSPLFSLTLRPLKEVTLLQIMNCLLMWLINLQRKLRSSLIIGTLFTLWIDKQFTIFGRPDHAGDVSLILIARRF